MTTTFTRSEATYAISEDALRQLQKTEAVGRLAGGVAHDFNNLLTVILGCGKLLEAAHGHDPESKPLLRDLLSAAEQGMMLTRQLLTFSRDRRPAPATLDLNELVGKLSGILRRLVGEQVELQSRFGPNVGPIVADAGEVQQVVLNLVVNARDAMPQGGTVQIETGQVQVTPASREGRTGIPEGVYSTLTVRDAGCGMTEEVMARVFDPFFSTKDPGKGTGLGLCTVHDVVKRSGGFIRIASKPGVGSRFRVFFPVSRTAVTSDAAEAAKPAAGRGAGLILVAEDSPSLRGLTATILRQQGYSVIEASNGAEALSLAEGVAGPIDLLFTDVRMPKLSGPELARELTARRPSLRVIYTSGYAECPLPSTGRPMLLKPYWPDELLDAVGAAINAPVN